LPDGLEWSIEKITGTPRLREKEDWPGTALKGLQERTAFLPDYGSNDPDAENAGGKTADVNTAWPDMDSGTSLSGIIGAAIVFGVMLLTGVLIRLGRRGRA
jgi:cobalt/nickel transport system permease protein